MNGPLRVSLVWHEITPSTNGMWMAGSLNGCYIIEQENERFILRRRSGDGVATSYIITGIDLERVKMQAQQHLDHGRV